MSKKIPAQIQCPSCGNKFNVQLHRTLWIEDPKNRELIFNNEVNAATCPSCKRTTRLEFPFLCTNIERKIAIWYEPYHDAEIDKDIALYKSKMGANSFYVNAPRIQDWEEFKRKLIELEKQKTISKPFQASEEMSASFSGFIKHVKKENQNNKYPKYLKHLGTIKGRLIYSFVPFLLLLLTMYVDTGSRLFDQMQRNSDDFFVFGVAWYVSSFVALTLLHLFIIKITKHWSSSRNLRLWLFGSFFWVLGVLLYVIVIEPYGRYMSENEYFHMFIVMLVPPLFIGSAKYVYEKHIK